MWDFNTRSLLPRLKEQHPAPPKKLMIEYQVAEVTLRHCFTAASFSLSLVSINIFGSLSIQGKHFSDRRIRLEGAYFSIAKDNRFVYSQTE